MASNLKYSNGTRNAQQQGLITYAGSGALINIYAGSQPANANTAISGQTLLVTLTQLQLVVQVVLQQFEMQLLH